MRRLTLLLFIFPFLLSSYAQDFTLRYFNRKTMVGFKNTFEFSLRKKYDSVKFEVSQGSVSKKGKLLFLTPSYPGVDSLYSIFYYKNHPVYRDTSIIDISRPEVFPTIQGQIRGKIKLSHLIAAGGIIFKMTINDYHWEPSSINSYRLTIVRQGKVYYTKAEIGAIFSEELKSFLAELKSGDVILISDGILIDQLSLIAEFVSGVFTLE